MYIYIYVCVLLCMSLSKIAIYLYPIPSLSVNETHPKWARICVKPPNQSGLPLPRVSWSPGFVVTNLLLDQYSTKVRSAQEKILYKSKVRSGIVWSTKVSSFFSFWLSLKFPAYFCRTLFQDFLITFVVKILSFFGGGPGSQVSFVVNLDSGFLQLLPYPQSPCSRPVALSRRPSSLFWDTAYLQTGFGHIQSSTKRILVSQETQLQDSYNLNTFSGPGRNAYKSIFVLQKPVLHQKKSLQNEALQNAL